MKKTKVMSLRMDKSLLDELTYLSEKWDLSKSTVLKLALLKLKNEGVELK